MPFIGQIDLFAGDFVPQDYLLCDGQLVQVAQHSALFAVLGITYGGDGETNFALPDLRSRAPMHWGSGPGLTPRFLGEGGGVNSVALTEGDNALHNHPMRAGVAATTNAPATDVSIANVSVYAPPSSPELVMHAFAIENNGSGTPHENRQPYLALNFIIAVAGEFPQRN